MHCDICGSEKKLLFNSYYCPVCSEKKATSKPISSDGKPRCPDDTCRSEHIEAFPLLHSPNSWHCWVCGTVWEPKG